MKNRTPRSAMNTQTGLGHMLESSKLLSQEFSTPPSLRLTEYIYSILLLTIRSLSATPVNCTTLKEWTVILVLERRRV